MAVSRAISPRWFIPISITARRCSAARGRRSVSGTPTSLLRLPSVFEHRAAGGQDGGDHLAGGGLAVRAGDAHHRDGEAAPVEAGDGAERRRACPRPRGAGAPAARPRRGPRATTAQAAPARAASARKSCPSKRSPRRATKALPAAMARVSVETPATRGRAARPASGRRWPAASSLGGEVRVRGSRGAEAPAGLLPVVEVAPLGAHDLVVLVPLAGDEHRVAGPGGRRAPARWRRAGPPRPGSPARRRAACSRGEAAQPGLLHARARWRR